MILKISSRKNVAKILAFLAQTTATFCKNVIVTMVFEKNVIFSAENGVNCDHSIDPRSRFCKTVLAGS
jgi:hypothetical protein